MNLFEKIEMFETLATSLLEDESISPEVETVEEVADHIERRNSIKARLRKLAQLRK